MTGEYAYKNLNQVLGFIRIQIIESVEWCYNNIPVMDNPLELWDWFKPRLTFHHDPKGDELLMTSETLFENNYWGIPGAGDCDDFTITAVAAFIAQGWSWIDIELAGRSHSAPVHIYTSLQWEGERIVFDLTESRFNQERPYPLYETVPIKFYTK